MNNTVLNSDDATLNSIKADGLIVIGSYRNRVMRYEVMDLNFILQYNCLHIDDPMNSLDDLREQIEWRYGDPKVSDVFVYSKAKYGREIRNMLRKERIIDSVIARLGNPAIITEFADTDPDNYERNTHVSRTTLREVLDEIYEDTYRFDLMRVEDIRCIESEYEEIYEDSPMIFFGTEEDWNNHKAEARRKELEDTASYIAREHGVKTNSLEFLSIVEEQIDNIAYSKERWNDPEIRAEQWASHMHFGSKDAYFDDLNYENSQYDSHIDKLNGIIEWVSENCPLLWAQYEERKLLEEEEEV